MTKIEEEAVRSSSLQQPIAVVGVAALFPGSTDAAGFWRDILAGKDLITDVPSTHWLPEDYYDPDPAKPDKVYGKRGGFLSPVDFDPLEFGMPPTIIPATDTEQLLAVIVAQKVLEDAARGQFREIDRDRVSVILGVTSGTELLSHMAGGMGRPQWVKGLRESGIPEDEVEKICDRISKNFLPWQESTFPGLLMNVIAGRVANRLNLGGTNCVVDAACGSSLAALSMSVNELRTGQSDLVVTGGVDALNDPFSYMCFSKTPALSRTGDCRPFSDNADGTILGEGLGMVALRRLADAERDGNRIYAVLRGLGSSSDGRAKSIYAPRPEGQAKALRRAYADAGYGPGSVELIEAHGTGTHAGDAAEFETLKQVFGESGRDAKGWCALGSVKSQIGHTKGAAGAAGLFKAVMALHHKVLPPTVKVDRPNPKLNIESSAFYINTKARPWIRGSGHPRRASVSSFGFGGSNFHVTLEEYAGAQAAPRMRTTPTELIVLGASTPAELSALCRTTTGSLAAVARKTQEQAAVAREEGAAAKRCRVAVVASSDQDLREKLDRAAGRFAEEAWVDPSGIYYGLGESGPVAFLFPGQGSHYLEMGADLAINFDTARAVWDRLADAVFDGLRLHEVVFPQPVFDEGSRAAQEKRLTATDWAQPALGAATTAQLALLRTLGIAPIFVGGHSFGEVVALHAAGVLDEASLLEVARRRGELMAAAAGSVPGAMTAVSHDPVALAALLDGLGIAIANQNSPKQSVISGRTQAIDAAEKLLNERQVRFKRLPVATAFHSELVASSCRPFRDHLEHINFAEASIPVFANSTGARYPAGAAAMKELLAGQIARPVRFSEQIANMYTAGARVFVEVGPSSVLSRLASECLEGRSHVAISLDRKGQHGVTSLWQGLGQLWAAGVPMSLAALWTSYPREEPPKKRSSTSIQICGANYGKPYPPLGGVAALPKPNPPRPKPAAVPALPLAGQTAQQPMQPNHRPLPPFAASLAAPPPNGGRLAPVPFTAAERAARLAAEQAPAPLATPSGSAEMLALVDTLREAQRLAVEGHTAFQSQLGRTSQALLRMLEVMSGSATPSFAPAKHEQFGASGAPADPLVGPQPSTHLVRRVVAPPPSAPVVRAAPRADAAPATPSLTAAPAPSMDLEKLLLEIVAEKTGYPAEVLTAEMELEAGLGIDSIKRVEILSAMQDRVPGLPAVKASEMAALRTLGEIVVFMQRSLPKSGRATVDPAQVVPPGPTPPPLAAAPALTVVPPAVTLDLGKLLLEIVAEKTGYPADVLTPEMELEAGLGIDSIKRVEILSAMQDRVPGLPAVKASEMAALRTLGEIVVFMQRSLPTSGRATATPVQAAPPPSSPTLAAAPVLTVVPPAVSMDLEKLLLEIVAEKTGYPAEVLTAEMELEAGLGIDSIKRVEILSAMQDRVPGLPAVKASEMTGLRTLGEIVAFMQRSLLTSTATAAAAALAPHAVPSTAPTIARLTLRLAPTPALGFALPGLFSGPIVVLDDGGGVAGELVNRLRARGVAAQLATAVPAGAKGAILLGGLGQLGNIDAAVAVNRLAFQTAKLLASALSMGPGLFVTVQDTGGDFGLSGAGARAWLGGLAGLAKTAAQEWPQASVRAIDLQTGGRAPSALAQAIVDELFGGGLELEVGLRADGTRSTLRTEPGAAAALPTKVIDERSVILASGGARGVTAAALIALARLAPARFVLLGRTPQTEVPIGMSEVVDEANLKRMLVDEARANGTAVRPAEVGRMVAAILARREIEATLEALRAAGAEARYFACDVQDAVALAAALAEIRTAWGPITGLVHGAGVVADKTIAEKTEDQFDRVFDTKVAGLRALLAATESDPLRFIALFSSVAARYGNVGQCDYAMANEILNKVAGAEMHRRAGCIVKSFNWGPWEGGMVTPSLAAHLRGRGVALIPLEGGARAFVEELVAGPPGEVEVVLGSGLAQIGDAATISVHVSASSHAFLSDHQVQGTPVVPVVLAMEWFARATKALRPGLELSVCRSLKVVKGVRLLRFREGELLTIQVKLRPGEIASFDCELRTSDRRLCYTAVVDLAAAGGPLVGHRDGGEGKLARAPVQWTLDQIYDGERLFHGPRFQTIRQLDLRDQGATIAQLARTEAMGWGDTAFLVDPAALDGGLQLARLWALRETGRFSLPTGIEEAVFAPRRGVAGPLRCVIRSRLAGSHRTLSDLRFFDEDGALVCELRGLEAHLLAGRADAAEGEDSAEAAVRSLGAARS